jgi:hypothetical protein
MQKIALPAPVAELYRAIEKLQKAYGRKFTLDGHVLGSIGEVVAQETFGFELLPMSARAHDAHCKIRGAVQVKITGGKSIAMRQNCNHLIVLKVVNPQEAEVVYDGPGSPVWNAAGRMQSNGQRSISLRKLVNLSAVLSTRKPNVDCSLS